MNGRPREGTGRRFGERIRKAEGDALDAVTDRNSKWVLVHTSGELPAHGDETVGGEKEKAPGPEGAAALDRERLN